MKKFLKRALTVLLSLIVSSFVCSAQLLPKRGSVAEQIANSTLFNSNRTIVDELLDFALQHQGIPYRYGSIGPKSFDCSGFTSYVFRKYGYDLNRTARDQYANGNPVSKGEEQPGDLVFFGGRKNGKRIGHVGIVLSKTETGFHFIHASCSRGITVSHSNEKYYRIRYKGSCRIINNNDSVYLKKNSIFVM